MSQTSLDMDDDGISTKVADVESGLTSERYKVTMLVSGMTCSSCSSSIETRLGKEVGVIEVSVNLVMNKANVTVELKEGETENDAAKRIVDAIEEIGFEASVGKIEKVTSNVRYKASILVSGMTCSSCSSSIETRLGKESGVVEVSVNLVMNKADLCLALKDGETANDAGKRIVDAIEEIGFEASIEKIEKIVSKKDSKKRVMKRSIHLTDEESISNLDSEILQKKIIQLDGVLSASVNSSTGDVIVSFDGDITMLRTILKAIQNMGYEECRIADQKESGWDRMVELQKKESSKLFRSFVFSAIFAIPLLIYSMGLMRIDAVMDASMEVVTGNLTAGAIVMWALATPVQFVSGMKFYKDTFKGLQHGNIGMSTLIAVGTTAAYVYSLIYGIMMWAKVVGHMNMDGVHFFETSAVLICFVRSLISVSYKQIHTHTYIHIKKKQVLFGKLLETRAKASTSNAIRHLMDLQPEKAVLVKFDAKLEKEIGPEETVSLGLLHPGDIVKVRPGSKIPADGIVISGRSSVDESMITGESVPVVKERDSLAIGSTINQDGLLYIQIESVGEDSMLFQIIRLVEDAQSHKAPIQDFADKISSYFVPVIIGLAFITFIIWIILLETGADVIPKDWYPAGHGAGFLAISFGLSVLVISCPCALGLAVRSCVCLSCKLYVILTTATYNINSHNNIS
jgi:P-type Cu+ transporter